MFAKANSKLVIPSKDHNGNIPYVEINGKMYQSTDGSTIAIPVSAIADVKLADFPKEQDIMLLAENGEALTGSNGITPTYIILIDDETAIIRCEINLCGHCWDGILMYEVYRDSLLHIFGIPERIKLSGKGFMIQDSGDLNSGFDLTIKGSSFEEILTAVHSNIDKILEPLKEIEENVKRELKNLGVPTFTSVE